MTLSIPYSFTAGTKAKAQEVNADFQAVQTEVNLIGSDLITAQTNITTLQNGKASVNGDAQNTFSVADPINQTDAVNKRYLSNLTKYDLFGLYIYKISGEVYDNIACTAGACFDSNGTKVLRFDQDVSLEEQQWSSSSTYYVYIVGTSAAGTNTKLHVSMDSGSPSLPSGYTLYRQLGGFTTDGDGNILNVFHPNDDKKTVNQWVYKKVEMTNATSGTRVLDFTSYLPSDGATYEVMFYCIYGCNNNNTALAHIDEFNLVIARGKHADSANNMYFVTPFILPVTSNRQLTFVVDAAYFNGLSIFACGYKKLS